MSTATATTMIPTTKPARTMGDGSPYCAPRARVRWEGTVEIREVPEYPDYWAGEDGSIWSSRPLGGGSHHKKKPGWRRLSGSPDKNGYIQIGCFYDGKEMKSKAHRLVLLAFAGPRPQNMECMHGPDPTKSNNKTSNLSWGTRQENMIEMNLSGRRRSTRGIKGVNKGERNGSSKLTEDDVRDIRRMHLSGEYTLKQIGLTFGVSDSTISNIIIGKNWSYVV